MTSPPDRVIKAFKTVGLIDFFREWTDPSAKSALKPFSQYPPSSGKGPVGSKGISSGLVQGMSRFVSTTTIVFDVPSVNSVIVGSTRSAPLALRGPEYNAVIGP